VSYGNKPKEIRHPQAALLAENYLVQRVQSLGYTADLNSEEVYQLTDSDVVEVVDSDPSVSITIDSNEFGSINLLNVLAGYYDQVDNTNTNGGVIDHSDFEEISTDFLVAIKENKTDTTQTRALWFNNCFLDSVSGTYQVDGFASESFSLSGSGQEWFLNAWASARVTRPSAVTSSLLTVGLVDGTARVVTEDGIKLATSYWTQTLGGDISAAGGYSFKADSRYRIVYTQNVNAFPTFSESGSVVGGVKEGEIEIVMWNGDTDSEPGIGTAGSTATKVLRVQSVDYELSFDREDLKQLYTGTYYKGLNSTSITATISLLDSDLELWALTTGNAADWSAGTLNEIVLSDFQSASNICIRIDVFNTKDYLQHSSSTLLKSIKFTGGKVTSVGDSRDVPGRGSQTIDIKFTAMSYTGTGLTGR